MKAILIYLIAVVGVTTVHSAQLERDLQALPPSVPKGRKRVNTLLDSYPDDITIDFNSNLKCGSCIRGGYIYCVNGKEGDADLHTK
jgi:hypothetical protein